MPAMSKFATWLAGARKQNKLSQAQLAKRLAWIIHG